MAAPITDESYLIFLKEVILSCEKNVAGYHMGPVTPSTTDVAPLSIFMPM